MFYGAYWEKKWASYYWRFNFGLWNKTIRDINSNHPVFGQFFNDFLTKDLDEIYNEKVKIENIDFETTNELDIFKWYASKLGGDMWKQGTYIAVNHYNHTDNDYYFKKIRELVNIKGTFNGGSPQVLTELVK
ncbi:MAG: hypothetical protein V3U80_07160 [Flavobacteriaceae bacterium]